MKENNKSKMPCLFLIVPYMGGNSMEKLIEEIIAGKRLTRNDDLEFLLTIKLESLCSGANKRYSIWQFTKNMS